MTMKRKIGNLALLVVFASLATVTMQSEAEARAKKKFLLSNECACYCRAENRTEVVLSEQFITISSGLCSARSNKSCRTKSSSGKTMWGKYESCTEVFETIESAPPSEGLELPPTPPQSTPKPEKAPSGSERAPG